MKTLRLSIIFLIAIHSAIAQDKDLSLVAGIGFPEMLHIGFHAGISPRSTLGFNAGANPSGFEAVQVTINMSSTSHFQKNLKLVLRGTSAKDSLSFIKITVSGIGGSYILLLLLGGM